ncbi:MAG TPA: outer membrane beta-barrel protein [Pseudidiomarina sp.]|nr:outer membrane beta-barrel protein [Pseudidiomarina sp.]
MYQKTAVITTLCFSSLFTLAASAQDFYIEPVFATSELKFNVGNDTYSYESLGLRVGWMTDSDFEYGISARTAINADNVGDVVEIKMNHLITGYFGKHFPLSEQFGIYGLLGVSFNDVETKRLSTGNETGGSSYGLSYEAGLNYNLSSQTAVRLGYQVYSPTDGQFDTESSFKLGFQWRW